MFSVLSPIFQLCIRLLFASRLMLASAPIIHGVVARWPVAHASSIARRALGERDRVRYVHHIVRVAVLLTVLIPALIDKQCRARCVVWPFDRRSQPNFQPMRFALSINSHSSG